MSDEPRPYRMQRRAESQEQTRLRITESAVELHGTIGPSRTSISAIAARAGVRRSTVYRHFPSEAALFDACSVHWASAHPPPDLDGWTAVEDPEDRLRVAVEELYAFYRQNEQMFHNLLRDEPIMPVVQERFAEFRAYLEAAREVLLAGRTLRGSARQRTRAALGHVLAFSTWHSLARGERLGDATAVALVRAFVAAAG